MKSRSVLFVFVGLLLSICSVQAQDRERGIFVEGVASYASTHFKNYAVLTPAVGYQFNPRWSAGFKVGFDTGDYAYVTYTPFARFNFLSASPFRMFVEGKVNFARRDVDGGQSTYQEAGFSVGALWAVSSHLRIVGQYLFLGWSNDDYKEGAWLGKHSDFALDANVRRFQLGLQVLF